MTTSKCQIKEADVMYKNKNADGTLNICGKKVADLRRKLVPKTSQRKLADMLQLRGLDVNKNAVQKIESGERFVTDIELNIIAEVLNVSSDYLLERTKFSKPYPKNEKDLEN